MTHTAYELSPIPILSHAEQVAAKKARERKWMEAAKMAEQKPEAAKVIAFKAADRWTLQHDRHVKDWRNHLKMVNEKADVYLKRRCRELGVSHADIIGPSRFRRHVEPRQQLMCEVKKAFDLSLPRLGRLFGGRDHTTCHHALKKFGVIPKTPEKIYKAARDKADEVYDMLQAGKRQHEIAKAIGSSPTAISCLIHKMGWTNPNTPRRVADHEEKVRDLFEQGLTFETIAKEIGFGREQVRKFIRRRGWTR